MIGEAKFWTGKPVLHLNAVLVWYALRSATQASTPALMVAARSCVTAKLTDVRSRQRCRSCLESRLPA
jgi:hypothetical protein